MSNPLYNDAGCPSACMAGGEYVSVADIYGANPIPGSTAVRIVPFQAQVQDGQVVSLPSVASQQQFQPQQFQPQQFQPQQFQPQQMSQFQVPQQQFQVPQMPQAQVPQMPQAPQQAPQFQAQYIMPQRQGFGYY